MVQSISRIHIFYNLFKHYFDLYKTLYTTTLKITNIIISLYKIKSNKIIITNLLFTTESIFMEKI